MIVVLALTASLSLPDTQAVMADVEAALVAAGFAAGGYARLAPPDVEVHDQLPRGDWGWSIPGVILISADQPEACIRITLAHEASHDATRRMGLIPNHVQPSELRAEMERIAAIVESHIAGQGSYAPNCLGRRH